MQLTIDQAMTKLQQQEAMIGELRDYAAALAQENRQQRELLAHIAKADCLQRGRGEPNPGDKVICWLDPQILREIAEALE